MDCKNCGNAIPSERVEAMPDTEYCVRCSPLFVRRKKTYMVFAHKTAPQLLVIDPNDDEACRRAERADKRCR